MHWGSRSTSAARSASTSQRECGHADGRVCVSIVADADFGTLSVRVLCPKHRVQIYDEREAAVYDRLYSLFRAVISRLACVTRQRHMGHILPTLRRIASGTQIQEGK